MHKFETQLETSSSCIHLRNCFLTIYKYVRKTPLTRLQLLLSLARSHKNLRFLLLKLKKKNNLIWVN